MRLEWSREALADLNRFATFLHQRYPSLAPLIAQEIIDKTDLLVRHPKAGRPIGSREDYRQIVLKVLNAAYVFQYRLDKDRVVMLRVFHGREQRD